MRLFQFFFQAITLMLLIVTFLSCEENQDNRQGRKVKGIKINTGKSEATDSLSVHRFLEQNPRYSLYRKEIFSFYSSRNYKLAWSEKNEFLPQAFMFINIVHNIDKEGLTGDFEESMELKKIFREANDLKTPGGEKNLPYLKEIDMLLTAAWFHHFPRLWKGNVNPHKAGLHWFIDPKKISFEKRLEKILNDQSENPFTDHEPLHQEYGALKIALQKYMEIEKNGGWPQVNLKNNFMVQGMKSHEVYQLARRLYISGDLNEEKSDSLFDEHLTFAVKKFQQRHGLDEDGKIGKETLQALNVPVEERIACILLNMERWRWVPEKPGSQYIIINIPEFRMRIYEEHQEKWGMNVIVGKNGTQTPVFNDEIEFIVFSPSWNIPKNLVIRQFLSSIKEDPSFLDRMNMELLEGYYTEPVVDHHRVNWDTIHAENFPFTIRQKPGPNNAMGLIKFLFPNEFHVYLHDTPEGILFSKTDRDFSNGCIRVEKPVKLAEYLLRHEKEWTSQKIKQEMHSGTETITRLKNKMPLYILYFTCRADNNGNIQFRNDLYGHDERLARIFFN